MELKLRPAAADDRDRLLAWRNDPITRANSRRQEVIPPDEHRRWLAAVLTDPARRLYVAELDGVSVGTCRVDATPRGQELSWTVAPEMRGKGIGRQMLIALVESSPGALFAEIREENIASKRIAEAAGLQMTHAAAGWTHWARPMGGRSPVGPRPLIGIIEYGMGNLRSVHNALSSLGARPFVAADPESIRRVDAIVLPGVGAFGDGMRNLRERGFIAALEREVITGRVPFLGICLGMELLATTSSERGEHRGLDWIPGHVERLAPNDPTARVPHIGWNDVVMRGAQGICAGLGERRAFYFVHSYVFVPDDPTVVRGVSDHGGEFAAILERDNIYATQFHPEKSQDAGLTLLRNFLAHTGGIRSSSAA